jgi:hypothetical protein
LSESPIADRQVSNVHCRLQLVVFSIELGLCLSRGEGSIDERGICVPLQTAYAIHVRGSASTLTDIPKSHRFLTNIYIYIYIYIYD